MTLYTLYPPIALATVVNAFAMALLWRGHKAELQAGAPPWWMFLLIFAYIGGLSAYFYAFGGVLSHGGISLFMTAMAGEAMGAAATFGILRAIFYTHGMAKAEIAAAYIVAFVFLGFLVWGTVSAPA